MNYPERVIWHDLECGSYRQDLPLWLELTAQYASAPGALILEIGAGSGRVSLTLARAGYEVVALDHDPELLAALRARAGDLPVRTVHADARAFEVHECRFALCIVPMQTVQLLGGADGRRAFLDAVQRHLLPGAVLAIAVVTAEVEQFQWQADQISPAADVVEHDGCVYRSRPIAVKRVDGVIVLERRRETFRASGDREAWSDLVTLDLLSAAELEEAGQRAGLKPLGIRRIAPSSEHAGSEVVLLGR